MKSAEQDHEKDPRPKPRLRDLRRADGAYTLFCLACGGRVRVEGHEEVCDRCGYRRCVSCGD